MRATPIGTSYNSRADVPVSVIGQGRLISLPEPGPFEGDLQTSTRVDAAIGSCRSRWNLQTVPSTDWSEEVVLRDSLEAHAVVDGLTHRAGL